MPAIETLGVTYDDAFADVSDSLAGLERAVNAALLTIYPERGVLENVASSARTRTNSDAVEVNALVKGKQITLVAEPGQPVRATVRDRDSLCVLSVGNDEMLWANDIKNSEMLKDHSVVGKWGAWLSAPIRVNRFPVGSVCALQDTARVWSEEDKQVVDELAKVVGDAVENWSRPNKDEDTDATT